MPSYCRPATAPKVLMSSRPTTFAKNCASFYRWLLCSPTASACPRSRSVVSLVSSPSLEAPTWKRLAISRFLHSVDTSSTILHQQQKHASPTLIASCRHITSRQQRSTCCALSLRADSPTCHVFMHGLKSSLAQAPKVSATNKLQLTLNVHCDSCMPAVSTPKTLRRFTRPMCTQVTKHFCLATKKHSPAKTR